MAPTSGTYFRSRVQVYHKDRNGVLHSLQNFDLSKRILESLSQGERSISTKLLSGKDLQRLRHIGLGKASEVDLVVEFPWDARSFVTIVAKSSDASLRRRVLVMALDRIRRTENLSKILAVKGLENCTIRENPYLGPGHAPYENFIESLLDITDAKTVGGEELFELFLKSAEHEADQTDFFAVEQRGVRTVFHGTNHAVMDAILLSGLDPNLRQPYLREDYFGIDYSTSLIYTKGQTSPEPTRWNLLVFMIIVEGWPFNSFGKITVDSNRLQLPLAEISL